MAIDHTVVGFTAEPVRKKWTKKDAMIYALGVGAGTESLQFTTDNTKGAAQKCLPTFAVIVGSGGQPFAKLGEYDLAKLVHGGQEIELLADIPPEGEVETVSRISAIWDKGTSAIVEMTSESTDASTGRPLMRTVSSVFFRGEGGWGGDRGPASKVLFPEREADFVSTLKTRDDQALIYRLSGDRNPLHTDPAFAQKAGFARPILHGLCTYGFTGRALLEHACGGDVGKFGAFKGKFSKPVFPGDELTVSIWREANTFVFRTQTQNGTIVFDEGVFTLR
jgi:acyl dehydratase